VNWRCGRLTSSVATAARPLVVLVVLVAGCHSGRPATGVAAGPGRTTVITQAQIAALGAPTAYEVVRAYAPRFFADAGQVRIQERRSVNSDETPLVVVDGVQAVDLGWLNQLPASEIALLSILDAEAAEPRYGLRAAGGAIVIVTKGAR
jgi:outer membrane cobalamin receptor